MPPSDICATGIDYRRLQVENEDRFYGAGLYYGAGASEAQFCFNDRVVVVGGGNSAAQATLHTQRSSSYIYADEHSPDGDKHPLSL